MVDTKRVLKSARVLKAASVILEDTLIKCLDDDSLEELKQLIDSGKYMSQDKIKNLNLTDEEADQALTFAISLLEDGIILKRGNED